MQFQVFVERKGNQPDPLELMMQDVVNTLGKKNATLKVFDISGKGAEDAKKIGLEEVPALLFEKVRISGQLNEYFILACVAQLLTSDGNDQTGSKILLEGDDGKFKLMAASAFLTHQTQIRDETKTFLLLIRESTDEYSVKRLKSLADSGTTIFALTNFKKGTNGDTLAKISTHDNILLGHIERDNIHKTLAITVRKGRPFFGAYLRTKNTEGWKGSWSPLLHDTVSELKTFYVPLFMTASPVHLDGTIPEEPTETNRLVAKVKDNVEVLKSLFY